MDSDAGIVHFGFQVWIIGLDYRFPGDKNPFPWLSEVGAVQAMGNFFERRVREYQQSGSLEDDF